jgi:hypothetical protein
MKCNAPSSRECALKVLTVTPTLLPRGLSLFGDRCLRSSGSVAPSCVVSGETIFIVGQQVLAESPDLAAGMAIEELSHEGLCEQLRRLMIGRFD